MHGGVAVSLSHDASTGFALKDVYDMSPKLKATEPCPRPPQGVSQSHFLLDRPYPPPIAVAATVPRVIYKATQRRSRMYHAIKQRIKKAAGFPSTRENREYLRRLRALAAEVRQRVVMQAVHLVSIYARRVSWETGVDIASDRQDA